MMILLWTLQLVQVSTCFPLRRSFSCFFLTTAIAGRYDGDVYNGLLERAQWSPLNRADVLPLFEKVRGRCRRRCSHGHTFPRRSSRPTVPDSTVSWPPNFEARFYLNISFLAFATGNLIEIGVVFVCIPEMFLNHFEEFERARDDVNNRLF